MKTRPQITLIALLATIPILWLSATNAATDGRLNETSRGKIEISLSILPSIQINMANDIRLSISDRSVDAEFSEYLCVTGNSDGRYRLVAYGDANDEAFVLTNEEGEHLPFSVTFRGHPDDPTFDQLIPGVPSKEYPLVGSPRDCPSTESFVVNFSAANLKLAGSGLYKGRLTLLVSPV